MKIGIYGHIEATKIAECRNFLDKNNMDYLTLIDVGDIFDDKVFKKIEAVIILSTDEIIKQNYCNYQHYSLIKKCKKFNIPFYIGYLRKYDGTFNIYEALSIDNFDSNIKLGTNCTSDFLYKHEPDSLSNIPKGDYKIPNTSKPTITGIDDIDMELLLLI